MKYFRIFLAVIIGALFGGLGVYKYQSRVLVKETLVAKTLVVSPLLHPVEDPMAPPPDPAAKFPNVPRKLVINQKEWDVILGLNTYTDNTGAKIEGQTDCKSQNIWIYTNVVENEDLGRPVLFHELLHAGACGWSNGKGKDIIKFNSKDDSMYGHAGADRLAFYLNDLYRNNPDLERYLFQ